MNRRDEPSRRIDQPAPGLFLLRLVRHGPEVAARIAQDAAGLWWAEIDGKKQGAPDSDPGRAPGVMQVWLSGRSCTDSEYQYHLKLSEWARHNAPDAPAADPTKPIDVRRLPIPF